MPMDLIRYGSFEVELDANGQPLVLGRGTFGSTYLARHRFLDTLAALKVINERFAARPDARGRFLSEARSVAKLDHKHIARVQDFGETGGVLFYAMEYCSGGTLEERIGRLGPSSVEEWIAIARQVASALACCHAAGFIHRDLKPSNLMLAQESGPLVVKLIDFGLVYSDRKQDPEESAEGGVGSPLYASPEQLKEGELDAKSDLFSLGMSLWHLAIGSAPDKGTTREIIERRLSLESYDPELPSSLPSELRVILGALLEKNPLKRPASATVLLEMLDVAEAKLKKGASQVLPAESERAPAVPRAVRVSAEMASEFAVVRAAGEQATGLNYVAQAVGKEGVFSLHVFHARLWSNAEFQEECLGNIEKLQTIAPSDLLRPIGVRQYLDYPVLISEAPAGVALLGELKAAGKLAFADAANLLHRVARACDACVDAGVPAPDLHPSHIYCEKGDLSLGDQVVLKLLPQFAARSSSLSGANGDQQDASATMAPEDLSDSEQDESPLPLFARLIYRMTAGRDCVAAASLSLQAYVAVPEISEEGNRFLAQVIAGRLRPASCGALLSSLLGSEGVVLGKSKTVRKSVSVPTVAEGGGEKAGAIGVAGQKISVTAPPAVEKKAMVAGVGLEAGSGGARQVPKADLAEVCAGGGVGGGPSVESSTAGAGSPSEKGSKSGLKIALIAAGIVAGVGILFVALSQKGPSPVPQDLVAEFSGELPEHSEFKVNGSVSASSRQGQAWMVPLGGAKFPVEVVFTAHGYDTVITQIKGGEDLKRANVITASRSKGTLVFKPNRLSDYDHFSVEMEDLLPEDAQFGLRAGERAGDTLRDTAETRISLPTGNYSIMLGGAPSVVSGFAVPKRVVLKPGSVVVCDLPPSYSGQYRSGSGQNEAELKVERDLRSGEFVFQSSGVKREGKIRRCKLDNKGTFNAEFLDAAGGVPSDVTARLSEDGGAIELRVVSRGADSTPMVLQMSRILETK